MFTLIVLQLIVLHVPDGTEIDVVVDQITSLRPRSEEGHHFTPNVKCLVNLTDGKFVTVVETCDEVRRKIEDAK